jgi:hydantoinase/carbamoylase family amidase
LPDSERVGARLEALWVLARGPGGGVDRPAYSAAEARAMRLVAGWAAEAGLAAGLDAHGNLWASPPGWDGPLVSAGSHVDSVPDGGRHDGALGTVVALELAHELRAGTAGGARPALLVCAAEEAPRFGAGTLGSRALAGTVDEAALTSLVDADGITAARARDEYLATLADLPRVEIPLARLRAHAEIHIAQRRSLESIGVVERVAAPRRLRVELAGEPGHAGEVPMEARRDALAAAAEVVLAVERAAREQPGHTVATVGTLAIAPGAVSVIPGHVRLEVDARSVDAASLDWIEHRIHDDVERIAAARGVGATVTRLRGGEPVTLDPDLARAALDAARQRGIAAHVSWSGAGHDVQHIAALVPSLLLFVPLRGGQSHTPFERAEDGEIEAAALIARDVLAAR